MIGISCIRIDSQRCKICFLFSELALADRMEKLENGSRYVFHLREAYWSNGDRISSQDFIYAWKTALDPLFPSENSYQLFCIKNAEAIKKRRNAFFGIRCNRNRCSYFTN